MVFVYDSSRFALLASDLELTRKRAVVTSCGVSEKSLRSALRTLSNHDLMLVPTDVTHHTDLVERMKRIAINAGIKYESIDTWFRRTQVKTTPTGRSAGGHAVPPSWHEPSATAMSPATATPQI